MIIENGPYTVYVLINTINNKLYVGTTRKKNIYNRFNYGWGYVNNKPFFNDIMNYGWDKIEQNIIARNLTADEAYNMEKLLISKFREENPELVYNLDAGGEHGKHCRSTIDIIKKANENKVVSEETKTKIREARAKQVFSKETYLKAAEKRRGRKMSQEFCEAIRQRKYKPIKCIETNKIYPSMQEAAKDLNISISGISQQCHGKKPHIKGFHFEYV